MPRATAPVPYACDLPGYPYDTANQQGNRDTIRKKAMHTEDAPKA